MANSLQASFKAALQNKEIDMNTDEIRAFLVSSAYTYSAAHDTYDDVSANLLGTATAVTGATISGASFDCADVTFTGVAAAQTVKAVWFVHWTGVSSTSKLIAYIDTGTGFPLTTTGNNIVVSIHASGVYTL